MIQIQNLLLFFIYVAAPAFAAIALMFLPAIIELKKPRDAGPRMLNYSTLYKGLLSMLPDIEEKMQIQISLKAAIFPGNILNLEA